MLPCFLLGMASAIDISATLDIYNVSSSPEEADRKAIASDWQAVGDDMRIAITMYRNGI
jgi:hypothetical protein